MKQYEKKRVKAVAQRLLRGTQEALEAVLTATGGGTGVNTAYIERLNATFRSRLAPLARRPRSLARKTETLQAGMFRVGEVYNFCTFHDSLRHQTDERKNPQTPAMAAGVTDHRWTPFALFSYRLPPVIPPPKKRKGQPSKIIFNQPIAKIT